ncbi:hypothetical protein B0J13DRAFT_541618 [Dactylonectria estremocensis]|uniref:C2H2-type domain-containing protein n=1 Tax=Dactylonectria estremocensis TaxID=1079267 RepID=A0A9P9FBC8_9HYPO|nr:hypothetical protein B0J13DRAFT_541618 [Dactylonectria estremocensis]
MILKKLTDPEASCGSHFTILPNGGHVWIAVGPAAEAWQSIRDNVRKIAEGDKYVNVHITIHFYMIGRSLAKASPYIMFFSDDAAARKELRKEVRQSHILKDFPWVRLGDASPLLQHGHHRLTPIPTTDRPVQSRPQTPAISEINARPDHHHQHDRSINHLSSSLKACSFSTSGSWRDSHHSGVSIESSASTRRTSVDSNTEQDRSEASTVRAEDCEAEDCESTGEGSSDEDDILSESGGSDESLPLPINESFVAHLPSVVLQLLDAFEAHRQLLPYHGSQEACGTLGSHQSGGAIRESGNADKGKKRALEANQNTIRGSNDESPQSDVSKKRRRTNQRGRVLACPFWKRDQRHFSRCYSHDLKEVKHVKQHLYRVHRSPLRCCRCQQIFNNEGHLAAHLRSTEVQCIVRDMVQGHEISVEQRRLLSKRGSTGSTQEEQWYLVWDIVFPGCDRPSSPYLDADLSEDLCEFREFYTKEGVEIVKERLRRSGHCADLNEQGILHRELDIVLSKALEAIYKSWITQRPQNQDEGSPSKLDGGGECMEGDICLESPNSESAGPSGVASSMDQGVAQVGSTSGEVAPGHSTMPEVAGGGINDADFETFLSGLGWERQTDGNQDLTWGPSSWQG